MTQASTKERVERLSLIYNPAFRRLFDILAIGTTDSPVRDEEVIALAAQAGIARGQRVLEPCSGSGGVSRLLAREFGCQVLGIDLVAYQLEQARKRAADDGLHNLISYGEGDASTYDYPTDVFDAAIDLFAWVHISDWGALFRRLHGALKPGGNLIIYDAFTTDSTTEETAQTVRDIWFDPGIMTLDECVKLLDESGYRVTHSEDRREQVLANWREGMSRFEAASQDFTREFGEEACKLFSDTIRWTIDAHEKGELTGAAVIAQKE